MTEQGREAYRTERVNRESIHEIMSCLSEEECRQLRSSLQKLIAKARETLGVEDKMTDALEQNL